MNYSDKQIEEIEKLASIFMPISDIAIVIDVPDSQLRYDISVKSTEVSKAYRKGKISTKMKLRAQEMQLAKIGSPQALINTQSYLLDMEDDE